MAAIYTIECAHVDAAPAEDSRFLQGEHTNMKHIQYNKNHNNETLKSKGATYH